MVLFGPIQNDSNQRLTELPAGPGAGRQKNDAARMAVLLLSIYQKNHSDSAATCADCGGGGSLPVSDLLWSAPSDDLAGRFSGRSVQGQREK